MLYKIPLLFLFIVFFTVADEWQKNGFSATEAKNWSDLNASPKEARALKNAGISLVDVQKWLKLRDVKFRHISTLVQYGFTYDQAKEWQDSGFDICKPYGFIGVYLKDIDCSDLRFKLLFNDCYGVLIASVQPNSPAEKAGLKPNMIIRKINEFKINEFKSDFSKNVYSTISSSISMSLDLNLIVGYSFKHELRRAQINYKAVAINDALMWKHCEFNVAEALEWKKNGFLPQDARLFRLFVCKDPSLARRWVKAGFDFQSSEKWAKEADCTPEMAKSVVDVLTTLSSTNKECPNILLSDEHSESFLSALKSLKKATGKGQIFAIKKSHEVSTKLYKHFKCLINYSANYANQNALRTQLPNYAKSVYSTKQEFLDWLSDVKSKYCFTNTVLMEVYGKELYGEHLNTAKKEYLNYNRTKTLVWTLYYKTKHPFYMVGNYENSSASSRKGTIPIKFDCGYLLKKGCQ